MSSEAVRAFVGHILDRPVLPFVLGSRTSSRRGSL